MTARRKRARGTAAGLLCLGLAGGIFHAGSAGAAAPPTGAYLVSVRPGTAAALAAELRSRGVTVTSQLDGVGTLAVRGPRTLTARLASDARVLGVTEDSRVALQGSTWSAAADAGSLLSVTGEVDARSGWSSSTGRGVDVALLDSGVSPVAGLDTPGKLVQGPDLSFDSQLPAMRHLDGFGHGTHLAGIIAGRDASFTGPGDTTSFAGVAPDARIISVKVADAYGNADVSQIIAGIDWVVQHRKDPGMNIRVLNLSLGLPSTNTYKVDPLAHAAEQAWRKGIVVVASAGNNARDDGQLLSPAYDPYLLAVGASDSKGTLSKWDDEVPDFSSRGTSERKPDVIAPGRSIASLRVPGSYLDQQHPGDGRYLRGSGTSQSTAAVSGAVALLLQKRPTLTPDAVKDALRSTAEPLMAMSTSQGEGRIRIGRALGVSSLSRQAFTASSGTGPLDRARGGYRVESGGVQLTGERDVFGKAFSAGGHAGLAAAGMAWTDGSWNSSPTTGAAFGGDGAWAGATWTSTDWAGLTWASRAGPPAVWNGRSWAGGYWAGRSWAGRSWAGRSWASESWG